MKGIAVNMWSWLALLLVLLCCGGCDGEAPPQALSAMADSVNSSGAVYVGVKASDIEKRIARYQETAARNQRLTRTTLPNVTASAQVESSLAPQPHPQPASIVLQPSVASATEVLHKARQSFRGPTREEYLYCLERLNRVAEDIEDTLIEKRQHQGGST